MKNSISNPLKTIIYWLLVILPIYKDSPLSKYLGFAGYTLLMPLVYVIFLVICFLQAKIITNNQLKPLFRLSLWLLVVGEIGTLIWFLFTGQINYLGDFLPVKAVVVTAEYLSYVIYIQLILYCIKNKSIEYIFEPIFFTLIILVIIEFLELRQIPYAFQSLHFAGSFPYYRVRLLTTESSATSMLIFIYGFLSLYYSLIAKSKIKVASSIICTVLLLSDSTSKTLFSALGLIILIYFLLRSSKLNLKWILSLFTVAALVIVFIRLVMPNLMTSFTSDINNFTSVSTRTYTNILAGCLGIIFPFGIGGAVYTGVLQKTMALCLPLFEKNFPNFNLSEIFALINSKTDFALTAKASGLQYNIYWGILGSIYLLAFFHKCSKNIYNSNIPNQVFLRTIFWSSILLVFLGTNWDFEFWMLVAIMINLSTNNTIKILL